MSHDPGLFHVYFVGIGDTSSNYTQNSPLYLVTFSSRSEADRWWRVAQLSSHNATKLRRFTPQFIMAPLPNIQEGWECIIQTLKDNFNPRKALAAVPDSRADHLNGGEYYVRSATPPHIFWTGGSNLSTMDPTLISWGRFYTHPRRFTIRRSNVLSHSEGIRQDEDILIGDDDVEIFIAPQNQVDEKPLQLFMLPMNLPHMEGTTEAFRVTPYISNASDPNIRSTFKFSWFENGFFIESGDPYVIRVVPDKGQRWVLLK